MPSCQHNYAFCNLIGALNFESGSVPSNKNVTENTRPSLYTYVNIWAQDYSQLCYAVPGLCIRTLFSVSTWGTLAHFALEEHFPSCLSLLCSSLSQKPLCPQLPWLYSRLGYSVCQIASQTNKHKPDAKTLVLVSIQLLICCLQFLLWKQQQSTMGTWLCALS